MRKQALTALTLTMLASLSGAAERQHGTHVHGEVRLNIAQSGERLDIEMHSPAMSLVGFEHAPSTSEQRDHLARTLEQLEQAETFITIPEAAGCQLQGASVERIAQGEPHHEGADQHSHEHEENAEAHHEHADHHDHEHKEETSTSQEGESHHSEIQATYRFQCRHPDQLNQMTISLASRYPAVETISVQLVTGTTQRAFTLSGTKASFEW